jgi:hypothetical protein
MLLAYEQRIDFSVKAVNSGDSVTHAFAFFFGHISNQAFSFFQTINSLSKRKPGEMIFTDD